MVGRGRLFWVVKSVGPRILSCGLSGGTAIFSGVLRVGRGDSSAPLPLDPPMPTNTLNFMSDDPLKTALLLEKILFNVASRCYPQNAHPLKTPKIGVEVPLEILKWSPKCYVCTGIPPKNHRPVTD